jgi:hypothetical protein
MASSVMVIYTGRFKIVSVITKIYNKKTKEPTLMELFTDTGKLNFFWELEMFDVCTICDTAYIDTITCHTRVNMGAIIFYTAAMNRA